MRKEVISGLCAFLAAVLLFPIPYHYKDGGTVAYKAILYNVQKVHRLSLGSDSGRDFLEGTIIEILGVEVFNNVA